MLKIKKYIQAVFVICLGFGIAQAGYAQEPVAVSVGRVVDARSDNLRICAKKFSDYDIPGLNNRFNLNVFQAMDVVQLIEILAIRGGMNNIVIGKGVSGLTTKLKFDDVSVGEALEVVLSVNNLAYTVNGGIITIMSDAEYRLLYGTSFYDNKQVKLIGLKYADPVRIAAMLAPVKSSIGTIVSDDKTGTIILIDTPSKISEMRAIIDSADINTLGRIFQTETKTFILRYADISDVKEDISQILTEEAGSIRSNERLRTIIVTDLPHKMREIEHVVAMFDRRQTQVFIEAKIIEVLLEDQFKLGVNWEELIYNSVNPRSQVSVKASPGLVADNAFSLGYKTLVGGADLSVMLEALKKISNAKVISNPHVAVLDGETAMVSVNTDQPYVETRKDTIGDESVAGTEVKFIPVGISLEVTPRILDDMILTKIHPEVSRADFKTFSYGTDDGGLQIQNDVPVVTKSYADTSVMVKSGETIIIAGMIQETKRKNDTHVPILGRIPLLGVLFRSTSEVTESKELAIFLTPRIISGEKAFSLTRDMKKAAKPLRSVGSNGNKKLKALR